MAARLFISTWIGAAGGVITHPILAAVDSSGNEGFVADFWADHDVNGVPDKPQVLVLVYSSNLAGSQIETLGNLTGVHLLPVYPVDTLLSTIPAAQRNAAQTYLMNNGFDLSSLKGSSTYFDLLKIITTTLAPIAQHPGLYSWLLANKAEFLQ